MTRHTVITVSIVEGNPGYRQALAQGLARCPGVVIFDKCADARAASEALAQRPPRVLLVGDSLRDTERWQWLDSLPRSKGMPTHVIAVSDSDGIADIQAAFRAGAVGYLLRNSPLALIHQALHDVTSGGSPLSPSVARAMVCSYTEPVAPTGLLAALTDRESEVLSLLSRGLRYEQIAKQMQVSANTIHTHTKNVYRKLKVSSKTEAAMIWLQSMDGKNSRTPLMSCAAG